MFISQILAVFFSLLLINKVMSFSCLRIKLKKNFTVYYSIKKNQVFFLKKRRNLCFFLNKFIVLWVHVPYIYIFFKPHFVNKNFILNKSKLSEILKTQTKKINQILFGLDHHFFCLISLFGLGFKFEKLTNKNILLMKLGYSHDISFFVPSFVQVINLKENRLLLSSVSKDFLIGFAKSIQKYKFPDNYKKKGIFVKSQLFCLKKVKKK